MANVIEILVNATDNASGTLQKVTQETAGLSAGLLGSTLAFAAIGAAAGAATTAIYSSARAFGSEIERLGNLSARTSATVAQLQVLEDTFQQQGVSAGLAGQALAVLNRAIGQSNPELARLGVNSKNSYEALLQLADGLQKVTPAQREAALWSLRARGLGEIIPVLNNLRDATGQMNKRLAETGQLFDENAVKAGQMADAITDAADVMSKGFARKFGEMSAQIMAGAAVWLSIVNPDLAKGLGIHPTQIAAGLPGATSNPPPGAAAGPPSQMDLLRGSMGVRGPQVIEGDMALRGSGGLDFGKLAKSLKQVEVPMTALTEAGQMAALKIEAMRAATARMSNAVASDISYAVDSVVRGTATIGAAFSQLIASIIQDIVSQAAKLGIGLGLEALSFVPGLSFLAPIGAAIAGNSTSGGGGTTINYISTMDSKGLQDQMRSVTGSWRAANERSRVIDQAARA